MNKRNLAGAQGGNLFADWRPRQVAPIKTYDLGLPTIRARCREMEMNNPLIRRYLSVISNNIVGSVGVGVKNAAYLRTGKPDDAKNGKIDEAFKDWANDSDKYSVNGCYDRIEAQRLILNSVARDGACIRMFDYQDGFQVNVLEIDHLAETYSGVRPTGNRVINGVEINPRGRQVAIWLHSDHPLDHGGHGGTYQFTRYPIDQAQVISMCDRAGQVVAVPWISPAVVPLRMLEKFLEAELVAARVSASKMGFYKSSPDSDPNDYKGDGTDDEGRIVDEITPGQMEKLPFGHDIQFIDPTHPNTTSKEFVEMITRYASSGLRTSYHTLGNDLSGVNYSSSRAGTLEDREEYLKVMRWFYRTVALPEKLAWYKHAVLSGAVDIPVAKMDESWKPKPVFRRWPWVDPLKDRQAVELAINMGMLSPQDAAEEYEGRDIYETIDEIAAINEYAKAKGVQLSYGKQVANPKAQEEKPPTQDL